MKHDIHSDEVPSSTVDCLITVEFVVTKTGEANWFCENRDCHWSVTLSVSDREETGPRCVCGWPLRRANAALASAYLEFLHNDEAMGKRQQSQKE